METSAVTQKGQVTIPASLRKRLGIQPGDRIAFVEANGNVILKPVESDIESLFGLIKATKSVSLDAMETAIRQRAGR